MTKPRTTSVRSMTGYGEASTTQDGAHFFVEIRSLNNKYFKSTIRLPEDLQGLEAELESRLRDKLSLPFALTGAQKRSIKEIVEDLRAPRPMNRLLQGDVGSGKTIVAAIACLAAVDAGRQAAVMAPTEILAEQHAATLRALAPALRVALLTASLPRAEANAVRAQLAAGEIELVVGTHALVQDEVRFARLALAIVDEQHRFGVLQRAALAARAPAGLEPHVLVMTATPIPRSLSLTLFGDLDVSVIDELPPGRSPVRTELLRAGEGRRVMEAVTAALARGEQVYVVYPMVEESEKSDLRAATESAGAIRRAFPAQRVELVHGRQSAAERAAAPERSRLTNRFACTCDRAAVAYTRSA